MSTVRPLQLTLAIIKPDIVAHPHIFRTVKDMILQNNFFFIRSKIVHLSRTRAEEFYKEHETKFFHNRLVSFMSSGPISTHILAKHNAIKDWRELMGPTKVFKTIFTHPDSIRGRFGLTDTRNGTHGSDSPETAELEIRFFFPEFDMKTWSEEEPYFRTSHVEFDSEQTIHILKDTIVSKNRKLSKNS